MSPFLSRDLAAVAVVLSFGDQDRGPFIEEKGDRTPLAPRDIGIPRFALIVEDVEEAYDEPGAKGAKPLGQPFTFQTGYVTQRASPQKSKS